MTAYRFSGFPIGQNVQVTVRQAGQEKFASIPNWKQVSSLPTLGASQWQVAPEDGLRADTAIISLFELPDPQGDMVVDAIVANVDGEESILGYGAQTNDETWRPKRRIRTHTDSIANVRLRVIWRNTTNGETELGAWSDPKQVSPAQITDPSVIIHVPKDRGTAPFGAQFYAEVFGSGELDPFQNCQVSWAYDDATSQHTNLSDSYVVVHGSQQANTSFDPFGAHTLDAPGTYSVTATTTINGENYTATKTILVDDPDVIYHGNRTIFVDPALPAPGTSNVPAGASVVATLVEAQTLNPTARPTRIIIQSGLDIDEPALDRFNHVQTMITAAPGPRPKIRQHIFFRYNPDNTECSLSGVELLGPYNPAHPGSTPRPSSGVVVDGFNTTIHNCIISGWNISIDVAPVRRYVISNTVVTNWADYGLFQQTNCGWHSIVGSRFTQNPLTIRAMGKAEKSAPIYADHDPYRCSIPAEPACILQSELFSANSWAGGIQLICRWNADGIPGQQFQMSQCKTEGGSFYFGSTASPTPASAQQFRVTKTHHVCSINGLIGTNFGGANFKNNIVILGDTLQESSTGVRNALSATETHNGTFDKGIYPNWGQAYAQPIRF
ncbi:hypothetical protein SAMN05444003_2359 [Cognatiyoonia sediminum]|uniref:Uncharacterized protein n=1 Tax=Cognatiyoonia sediminum TaxID=1508389 RepID=A0A1M5QW44_9RHOB|nr:hypothetical protein [Cognatiyoonia sediminum]SHH18397.1 hypothetical protein SAMN05444003_2359 [Cognatiyoonia sediminum]